MQVTGQGPRSIRLRDGEEEHGARQTAEPNPKRHQAEAGENQRQKQTDSGGFAEVPTTDDDRGADPQVRVEGDASGEPVVADFGRGRRRRVG